MKSWSDPLAPVNVEKMIEAVKFDAGPGTVIMNPKDAESMGVKVEKREPQHEDQRKPCPFQVGDMLYASCAGAFYGEVVGIGEDANGIPTVDLKVFDSQDLIDFPWAEDENEPGNISKSWPDFHGLTRLELPEGVTPILRDVQWKRIHDQDSSGYQCDGHVDTGTTVECVTPGNGCYRCTKYFSVYRKT